MACTALESGGGHGVGLGWVCMCPGVLVGKQPEM